AQRETATLALELLASCGSAGRDVLGRLAAGYGPVARQARRALVAAGRTGSGGRRGATAAGEGGGDAP
ncbi:MAG TPA: hypothetical protein VGV61_01815, partial [Thermoanaerobaculia bacterium]|nr:hypothetical protein [Thermoanaerobaculia bacterium]